MSRPSGSPDGAKRNPGRHWQQSAPKSRMLALAPNFAALHPGYDFKITILFFSQSTYPPIYPRESGR
jgi:hypothetical protein